MLIRRKVGVPGGIDNSLLEKGDEYSLPASLTTVLL